MGLDATFLQVNIVLVMSLVFLANHYATADEDDKLAYCYKTVELCRNGRGSGFPNCAKRCRVLEYAEAAAHCIIDYRHCERHNPAACHCAGEHKLRTEYLWPFNLLFKNRNN